MVKHSITRMSDGLVRLVNVCVVLLASVMLAAIGWQVTLRYLFNRPPSWTEELALLCFTWTMLLMMALGVRQAFHARIDLLLDRLPAPWAQRLENVIGLMTLFFGGYLALGGWRYMVETATSTSAARVVRTSATKRPAVIVGTYHVPCFFISAMTSSSM